ncbi:hypothetical protein DEJ48_02420 [Streptomyces venezuelae]|uniref:Uncharacterized protein n=1 Tax=Streptomyces venezuelae TaxID=54571 RepID=A0A5P2CDB8_STRVZ|nr:hypothetical protein DEJ48_02420 [Streptomyces venezuelae]
MEQVASDLEENRRRQEELAQRIDQLKQEEALLTDILSLAERYEGFADASRLPEQAQGEPTIPRTKGSSTRGSVVRGSVAKAKSDAKQKADQPLLGDLLLDLLAGHHEPRSARELGAELREKHPSRNPTPQVVRNTLESLVAKARIQRHKQQRSVTYTVVT